MQTENICPSIYTAVSGTNAVTIIPASGNTERYRHLVSLVITTPDASAATLTISDGTKTVFVLDYPDGALAPGAPFVFEPSFAFAQSAPNAAWTITASANASGLHVTAQYCEN